jgi:hypothetical protein
MFGFLAVVCWAEAMPVTQLDLTGGSVRSGGRFDRVLDRLLDQDGVLKMGEFQPIGEIVPSITNGHTTFSLFTSGFSGAPAPSATIDGSSITADLSSLFFAVSRGDSIRLWNIGSLATGTFDPETSQFNLSWKDRVPRVFHAEQSHFRPSWGHLFEHEWDSNGRHKSGWPYGGHGRGDWTWDDKRQNHPSKAVFFLEGTAVAGPPAVVAIPATLVLYASGLLGLGSWVWLKRRQTDVRDLGTQAGCLPVDEHPSSCRS